MPPAGTRKTGQNSNVGQPSGEINLKPATCLFMSTPIFTDAEMKTVANRIARFLENMSLIMTKNQ